MFMLVAPVISQLSMELLPASISGGSALNILITGASFVPEDTVAAATPLTDIWHLADEFPAALLAVSIYMVVTVGETVVEPLKATLPTPWSINTLLAPLTDHERVQTPPASMIAGLAVNVLTTGLSNTEGRSPAMVIHPDMATHDINATSINLFIMSPSRQ
jgi:hypothetical protein